MFIDELNNQLRLSDYTVSFNGRNTKFQSIKVKPSREEIEAHFEDNRKTVINCIRDAKYLIWVAVAWFTDEIIYRELIAKKNAGVNVQVIMLDDVINNNSGLVFRKKIEAYKVKPYGNYENIMHEKFCIIDLEKVIYGSYNWTNKAQYNDEHITVDSHHKSVQRFADEFIRLKERELSKKQFTT
jgi:phosphatidylserine/phosphatidylglycerophosphate/cardiolipin synthase-like enzyme